MPIGAFHREQGLLVRQRGRLVLARDDGGRWRLELDDIPETLIGERVQVEGVRSGFDIIEVSRIAPATPGAK